MEEAADWTAVLDSGLASMNSVFAAFSCELERGKMTLLKLLNFQHILMLSVFTGAGERNGLY